MTKITLLGDSIRQIGYGKIVPGLLGEEYEVYQPDDNCRFSKYTLRGLYDWKQGMTGSQIVHWNNGLWDVCDYFSDGLFSDENEYITNMLRIADVLISNHEKVIFATTTPVTERNVFIKNSDIERYNEIIVPLLEEKGVIINDLYSIVSKDIERYIKQDNIHLSDEGVEICAKQVADVIRNVSKTLDTSKHSSSCEMNINQDGIPV